MNLTASIQVTVAFFNCTLFCTYYIVCMYVCLYVINVKLLSVYVKNCFAMYGIIFDDHLNAQSNAYFTPGPLCQDFLEIFDLKGIG